MMGGAANGQWVRTRGEGARLFLQEREQDERLRRARHERVVAFWVRLRDALGPRWTRRRGRGHRARR